MMKKNYIHPIIKMAIMMEAEEIMQSSTKTIIINKEETVNDTGDLLSRHTYNGIWDDEE